MPKPERIIRHAPPAILNVTPGQPVELRVAKRLNESYQPSPSRRAAAFVGTGNRLGAPVPETSSTHMPGSYNPSTVTAVTCDVSTNVVTPSTAGFAVDPSLPQTSIQIRLADGTRSAFFLEMALKCSQLTVLQISVPNEFNSQGF